MKKFAIIDTIKNKVIRTYTGNRMKNLSLKINQEQFEMKESNGTYWYDEKAYSWNSSSNIEEFDTNYVPFDPESKFCKIYRFIPESYRYVKNHAPIGHDYKVGLTTTLFPKRYFNKGELYKVEYFSDEAQTDLVVNVDINYTRDALGFATERTTTRTWYREDGTAHPDIKVTKKIYANDTLSQIKEGIKRRGNVVEGLQMPVLGSMLATVAAKSGETEPERQGRILLMGRKFLADYKEEFTNYIQDSNKEILSKITAANDFWLENVIDVNGTTIRDMILFELTIDEPV